MPGPARLLPVVLLGALLLGGCSDDPAPERPVEVVDTTIADYDGTTVTVSRASFCELYADKAVAAAVGEVTSTRHHGNGEKVPGVGDLGHEYGCTFVGEDRVVASAWVFVPPVTVDQAKQLVRDARSRTGCRAVPGHRFGSPALGLVCRGGRTATASYRGLFGDAWLTCEIRTPEYATARLSEEKLLEAAGDWCVQSATAAAG